MAKSRNVIGRLPRVFIVLAFINFLVGAILGGWMAVQPSVWELIGAIHAEINPFGWLTMLIYGMTYAVLVISAGIRPPKAWVGWAHLVLAELAVLIVVTAWVFHSSALLDVGFGIQFAAPVVFLANILSAVFSSRRMRQAARADVLDSRPIPSDADRISREASRLMEHSPIHDTLTQDSLVQYPLSYLQRHVQFKATDRVGQRGTDVSLILFLVGAVWIFVRSLAQSPLDGATTPGALFLIYYGWIAGTIFAVALHLFPRFTQSDQIEAKQMSVIQIIWGIASVIGTVGLIASPVLASIGSRLMGVAFIWSSVVYLRMLAKHTHRPRAVDVQPATRLAWVASWLFCLALGGLLLFGLDPLALASMHALFLGFATTLVYGIGYTVFPHLMNRPPARLIWSLPQVIAAVFGALLMVIAFLDIPTLHPGAAFALLGVGGTLAALSAIGFLLQWAFTRNTSSHV